MSNIEVFHFDKSKQNFENFAHENGSVYWFARDLMTMLGYDNYSTFHNAINKAMSACAALNIPIDENFISVNRDIKFINSSIFSC